MANSKNYPCKIVWFTLILFSIIITGVSIFYEAQDFFSEATDVSLVRKKGDEMFYPPLKICIHHWMGWVNWTAATEMNFTKQEVQFAMSYLTEVYTNDAFDIDETEKSFYEKLQMNNLGSVKQFYKSIAYQNRHIIKEWKGDSAIPQYEIIFGNFWNVIQVGIPPCQLCYYFSSEEVKKILLSTDIETDIIENNLLLKLKLSDIVPTKDDILKWLTESEYAAQIEGDNLFYNNHITLDQRIPVSIYPDAFGKKLFGIRDGSSKVGVMNVKVTNKVSLSSAPCHEGHRWITTDSTCIMQCTRQQTDGACTDTLKNRKIFLVSDVTKGIPFERLDNFVKTLDAMYKNSEIRRQNNNTVITQHEFDKYNLQARWMLRENLRHQAQCEKECEPEFGCESWSYSFHAAKMQQKYIDKNASSVVIIYPSAVAATKEIYVQTWENFASKIGGLLGIFLGASFLTIFQFFHFCCSLCPKNQVGVIQVQPPN